VHVSQTAARESFRHHSVISPVVDVTITGAGAYGYELGVLAARHVYAIRQPDG
jgi:3-dehydroquinate dehydratase-2